MKKIALFLLLLLPFATKAEVPTGINFFKGTWSQALEKAKKENKLIFMDCYAAYCGPCLLMAKNEFPKKEVADFYNEHFVNVKINIKEGFGISLAKKYSITFLPSLLFINVKGYDVCREIGFHNAEKLVVLGKKALTNIETIPDEERFDKGNRDITFITKYTDKLVEQRLFAKLDSVLQQIVKESGEQILLTNPYYNLLQNLNLKSPLVNYFFKNQAAFSSRYGIENVKIKAAQFLLSPTQMGKMYNPYPPHQLVDSLKSDRFREIGTYNIPDSLFLQSTVDFYIAYRNHNDDKALEIANHNLVNAQAWQLYLSAFMVKFNSGLLKEPAVQWLDKATTLTKDTVLIEECKKLRSDFIKQ